MEYKETIRHPETGRVHNIIVEFSPELFTEDLHTGNFDFDLFLLSEKENCRKIDKDLIFIGHDDYRLSVLQILDDKCYDTALAEFIEDQKYL